MRCWQKFQAPAHSPAPADCFERSNVLFGRSWSWAGSWFRTLSVFLAPQTCVCGSYQFAGREDSCPFLLVLFFVSLPCREAEVCFYNPPGSGLLDKLETLLQHTQGVNPAACRLQLQSQRGLQFIGLDEFAKYGLRLTWRRNVVAARGTPKG